MLNCAGDVSELQSWKETGEVETCPTCEGVDDEAEDHGDHRDENPVREPLVLHAAVDGDGCLVALEHTHREKRVNCWDFNRK